MTRIPRSPLGGASDVLSQSRPARPVLARVRALLIATGAAAALAAASPALASALTISPLPGTPDASPSTQISILGTAPSNIVSVSVTGSVSGPHEGHLESYSGNQGASFILDTPLAEGEEVSVVVDLSEGAPVDDSFSVANTSPLSPPVNPPGEKPEELESFRSAPELRPPKIRVTKADPSLAGDIFLDPLPSPIIHVGAKLLEFEPVGPNGPMILNPEGKLIWWDQLPEGQVAGDLQAIRYEGKPALAWWQGIVTEAAYGEGEGIIANSSYEPVARIKAGNGYQADIHELNIGADGEAYVAVLTPVCLPTCSEANPPVLDSVVQEVDIHTGLVMWEWHALGHIPVSDTEVVAANGVLDAYHINSIQPLPEHHLLISLRDTSGVYELEQNSGAIVWALGGRKNMFTLVNGAHFYFQHDARLQGSLLTLFDDEAGPPVHGSGRGLAIKLNLSAKKATLMHQFHRSALTYVLAEGSVQRLGSGDFMVGFGATKYFAEFSRSEELLFEAELPKGDGTYRVLRAPWKATPKTLPAVAAVRESPDEVAVSASWNGATGVAKWEVLAGESPEALSPVASAPWSGFETTISVPSADSTFEVRALDSRGRILASSAPVSAP